MNTQPNTTPDAELEIRTQLLQLTGRLEKEVSASFIPSQTIRRYYDCFANLLEQYDAKPAVPQQRGRSLPDYADHKIDDTKTLLGSRYLCRGGAMLFVGPSGIGKSSAAVQQDICWSCGREAFGIKPARPLRILTVQAENDDGDLAEMTRGVFSALNLSQEDLKLVHSNTHYEPLIATADEFLEQLRYWAKWFQPDLIRLDPLNAFLGDDAKETRAVSDFCRIGLNQVAVDFELGFVVNHHTPKTNHRDTTEWAAHDWMYAGAGAADLTNWARAVLVVEPIDSADGLFKFIAAKRGKRIGWRAAGGVGEVEYERYFRHAKEPGVINWIEADESEAMEALKSSANQLKPDDLLALVPDLERIEKNTLETLAANSNIGEKRFLRFLEELLDSGKLFLHLEKRKGTNPKKLIARFPQEK